MSLSKHHIRKAYANKLSGRLVQDIIFNMYVSVLWSTDSTEMVPLASPQPHPSGGVLAGNQSQIDDSSWDLIVWAIHRHFLPDAVTR